MNIHDLHTEDETPHAPAWQLENVPKAIEATIAEMQTQGRKFTDAELAAIRTELQKHQEQKMQRSASIRENDRILWIPLLLYAALSLCIAMAVL